MDFLNKAYGQASELLASMTPAARITTGLLVAVIAISLMFLFRQGSDKPDDLLFGGAAYTDGELREMQAAFAKKDLNDWEVEGNRLRVPRSQRPKYIAALVENDALPKDWTGHYDDVLQDQNWWENRDGQAFRRRVARAKTMAHTIREFEGVVNASVEFEEVPTGDFRRSNKRTAAVSVSTVANRELEPAQVKMIRDYVAFGGGVDPRDIAITDGNRSYEPPPDDGSAAAHYNAYAAARRQFEEETRRKIRDRLSMYPDTKVTVSVELDEKLENKNISIKYDEKPTPLRSRTESRDSSTVSAPGQGRPGAAPNGVGNQPLAVSNSNAKETTESFTVEEQENRSGISQSIVTEAPLVPKVIYVSIGIPQSYFKTVWQRQNPTLPGEDPRQPEPAELQALENETIADIEKAVVTLIPKAPQGEDTFPRVSVVPYMDLPPVEIPLPSVAATATSWFASHWQTLAMLGIAMFGLLFLRSMLRSAQDSAFDPPAAQLEVPQLSSLTEDDEEDEDDNRNSLRFTSDGRSLREELTDLVREDPDAAASVLQNWISEAA